LNALNVDMKAELIQALIKIPVEYRSALLGG
jgi:hypothetical protein